MKKLDSKNASKLAKTINEWSDSLMYSTEDEDKDQALIALRLEEAQCSLNNGLMLTPSEIETVGDLLEEARDAVYETLNDDVNDDNIIWASDLIKVYKMFNRVFGK